MLHILIYGDGQDRETLLTLMDRSQPIAHCEKRYKNDDPKMQKPHSRNEKECTRNPRSVMAYSSAS